MLNLTRNSFEPLYYQLKEIIREKISNNEYKVNDLIPSETELCKMYNVSRITVRKAILDLVQEGVLYRGRGLGTFVAEPFEASKLYGVHGFTEEILKLNQRPSAKLLDFKIKKATAGISEKLNISKEEMVILIKRIRYVNDEPCLIENMYFPYSKVEGIEKANLEGSIYQILKDKYNYKIDKATEIFEPVILDEFESKMLNVKSPCAGLRIERIGYINDRDVLEYTIHIIVGSKCKFSIERKQE